MTKRYPRILNEWTDGEKIVLDSLGDISELDVPDTVRYYHCSPDEVEAFIETYPHLPTTFYITDFLLMKHMQSRFTNNIRWLPTGSQWMIQ
jgi:hypothetical protein